MRTTPLAPLTKTHRAKRRNARNRRVTAVFFAGALSIGVGACGTASTPDATPAPSSPIATAPATTSAVAPATTARVEAATVAPATFSGEAVDRFGADNVQAAYTQVGDYLNQTSFNETLLSSNPKPTAADFEFATAYMTPSMAADYRSMVQQALSGDETASSDLHALSFYDVESDGVALQPGPVLTNHNISNPQTSVNANGSLRMVVTETGMWHLVQNGQRVRVPVTKTSTFALAKNDTGSGPAWLVDGVSSEWAATEVTPE